MIVGRYFGPSYFGRYFGNDVEVVIVVPPSEVTHGGGGGGYGWRSSGGAKGRKKRRDVFAEIEATLRALVEGEPEIAIPAPEIGPIRAVPTTMPQVAAALHVMAEIAENDESMLRTVAALRRDIAEWQACEDEDDALVLCA